MKDWQNTHDQKPEHLSAGLKYTGAGGNVYECMRFAVGGYMCWATMK